jgi:hypothetical protein
MKLRGFIRQRPSWVLADGRPGGDSEMDELEDRDWAVHIVIHDYRWPGGGRRWRRGGPTAFISS